MIVRIRFGEGRRVQRTAGKKKKVALAVAALLTPICMVAWVLALWCIGSDLGATGGFAIDSGLLSHWQVWLAIALVLQFAIVALNRFGHSGGGGRGGTIDGLS